MWKKKKKERDPEDVKFSSFSQLPWKTHLPGFNSTFLSGKTGKFRQKHVFVVDNRWICHFYEFEMASCQIEFVIERQFRLLKVWRILKRTNIFVT